jgi:pimeloyl-ACP methyl ester carboxylesterase
MFVTASFPGVVRAVVLAYYLRTGVYLGPDFVSVLPAASRIACPVLLISGERDWIVPPADARSILAALPGHRKSLVTIPNASHDTTYDSAPTLYRGAVMTFLDTALTK